MEVQQIEEKLKTALKPSRYRHTLGVAYTASCMAMVFGVDVHKAYRAGLLHDCAKGFSMEEQRALCKRYNISLEGTLTKSPQLMHQEIAPFLASDEYKEQDSEVLSAIASSNASVREAKDAIHEASQAAKQALYCYRRFIAIASPLFPKT